MDPSSIAVTLRSLAASLRSMADRLAEFAWHLEGPDLAEIEGIAISLLVLADRIEQNEDALAQ